MIGFPGRPHLHTNKNTTNLFALRKSWRIMIEEQTLGGSRVAYHKLVPYE